MIDLGLIGSAMITPAMSDLARIDSVRADPRGDLPADLDADFDADLRTELRADLERDLRTDDRPPVPKATAIRSQARRGRLIAFHGADAALVSLLVRRAIAHLQGLAVSAIGLGSLDRHAATALSSEASDAVARSGECGERPFALPQALARLADAMTMMDARGTPLLAKGFWVLSDGYALRGIAELMANGSDRSQLSALAQVAALLPAPDLAIVIDGSDSAGTMSQRRLVDAYRRLAAANEMALVQADGSGRDAWHAIRARLECLMIHR